MAFRVGDGVRIVKYGAEELIYPVGAEGTIITEPDVFGWYNVELPENDIWPVHSDEMELL